MTTFLSLFLQMLPLYALVFIGYIAGTHLGIKKDAIAKLLLYVLLPVVCFNGILVPQITLSLLSIPLLSFCLCTIIAVIVLTTGRFFWKDSTKNMLSIGIANGNFGFIGLPLTLLLFGQKYVALTALWGLGGAVFVATVGMFIAARARYNFKQSLIKVAKMPILYAFGMGFLLNVFHIPIHSSILHVLENMTASYSVLGLMLVGIAMSELKNIKVDYKLMGFTAIATFVLWPLVAFGFIALDRSLFSFFSPDVYKIVLLMSVVPVGASVVSVSNEFDIQPEKAAFVVLFTTIISLIFIPVFIGIFF